MIYAMYADHAIRLVTTTCIKHLLGYLRVKAFIMIRLLINLLNVVPNTELTCFNDSFLAEM